MVLSVLSLVGVVNIGEPYNKQVYAVKSVGETLTDQVREIFNSILTIDNGDMNYCGCGLPVIIGVAYMLLLWVWPNCYCYRCGLTAIILKANGHFLFFEKV